MGDDRRSRQGYTGEGGGGGFGEGEGMMGQAQEGKKVVLWEHFGLLPVGLLVAGCTWQDDRLYMRQGRA